MASIAPLDTGLLADAARTGAIVTAEEGLARGGLGGAVAEWCAENAPVRMRLLGFPGFLPTGSAAWLMDRFGLSADGIAGAARELLGLRAGCGPAPSSPRTTRGRRTDRRCQLPPPGRAEQGRE